MTHPIRARLLGLAATVAILTVLIGVPATLVAIGANPIPTTAPHLDQLTTALTTRDDGTLTLRSWPSLAWLAWAFLTATITLEMVARLRGAHRPTCLASRCLSPPPAAWSAPPSCSSSPPHPRPAEHAGRTGRRRSPRLGRDRDTDRTAHRQRAADHDTSGHEHATGEKQTPPAPTP
jgi:hypothetical protein